jgi:hypothetical protein
MHNDSVQLVLLYSLCLQNVPVFMQTTLPHVYFPYTYMATSYKQIHGNLYSKPRGHKGNVSLTENVYSPEVPNFRYQTNLTAMEKNWSLAVPL